MKLYSFEIKVWNLGQILIIKVLQKWQQTKRVGWVLTFCKFQSQISNRTLIHQRPFNLKSGIYFSIKLPFDVEVAKNFLHGLYYWPRTYLWPSTLESVQLISRIIFWAKHISIFSHPSWDLRFYINPEPFSVRSNQYVFTSHKVASSRPAYYSILNSFGQRSQYISIKFPLHKPSENLKTCY